VGRGGLEGAARQLYYNAGIKIDAREPERLEAGDCLYYAVLFIQEKHINGKAHKKGVDRIAGSQNKGPAFAKLLFSQKPLDAPKIGVG
jgi:hypothetical protein